jgi:hypothetical protein
MKAQTQNKGVSMTSITQKLEQKLRQQERHAVIESLYYKPPSTGATFAYTVQVGRYTRIGPLCHVQLGITLNGSPGGTTSNAVTINLPVTSADITNLSSEGSIYWSGWTLGSGYTEVLAVVAANSSTLVLRETGSGKTAANILASMLGSGATVTITIDYLTA